MLNPSADYNFSAQSDVGRGQIWKRGVGYMYTHPMFGVGVSAFPVAEGTLSERAALQQYGIGFKWSTAHNSFLQVGAELGFPGLLLFFMLLGAAFRTTWKLSKMRGPNRRPPPEAAMAGALTASLIGYCVCGFFLSQGYSAYLYTVVAMVVGLAKVTRPGFATPTHAAPLAGQRGQRAWRSLAVPGTR